MDRSINIKPVPASIVLCFYVVVSSLGCVSITTSTTDESTLSTSAFVSSALPIEVDFNATDGKNLSTVDVVNILRPSVVQITTETLTMGCLKAPMVRTGVGAGVILDEYGHILTNSHVIAGAQLIEKGRVQRGFFGISPLNLTPILASRFNIPVAEGVIIANLVSPNSPAFSAGLRQGDITIQLGDSTISNMGELSKFLLTHQPGDFVSVAYLRKGKLLDTIILLKENPKSG